MSRDGLALAAGGRHRCWRILQARRCSLFVVLRGGRGGRSLAGNTAELGTGVLVNVGHHPRCARPTPRVHAMRNVAHRLAGPEGDGARSAGALPHDVSQPDHRGPVPLQVAAMHGNAVAESISDVVHRDMRRGRMVAPVAVTA